MDRVVICMKWGTLYGPDYVNVLYSAVRENVTGPFRFVCLTDQTDGLHSGIETFPIPDIGCTPEMWRHGAWPKLSVFAGDLYGLSGRALFIDMDTVVCGPLDRFFDFEAPFAAIDTGDNWRPGGEPGHAGALVGTGIFVFNLGEQTQILTEFQENPQAAFDACKIEQVWVQKKGDLIGVLATRLGHQLQALVAAAYRHRPFQRTEIAAAGHQCGCIPRDSPPDRPGAPQPLVLG